MSSKIKEVEGRYIYPCLLFELIRILLFKPSLWAFLFCFFILWRLFLCQSKALWLGCVGVAILAIVMGMMDNWQGFLLNEATEAYQLVMKVDTLTINGDLLRSEVIDKESGSSILVSYKLKNEEEKEWFLGLTDTVELEVLAHFLPVDAARNLNTFDYDEYLQKIGKKGTLVIEEIQNIQMVRPSIKTGRHIFREWRRGLQCYIYNRFDPLTASYMSSLLLGEKNTGISDSWKKLGLMHLYSLSGMHIIFFLSLYEGILRMLRVTKETIYWLKLPYIVVVLLMTGMGIGMLRASITEGIKCIAGIRKKEISSLDQWSLTLFFHCFLSPYVLLTVGGQLSYYLTFIIVFLVPLMTRIEKQWVRGFLFSLILSVCSLPLIWFYFYEWNWLVFFINNMVGFVLLWCIMPMLLLVLVLSFFMSSRFSWCYFLLSVYQGFGEKLSGLRFSQQIVGKPAPLLVLLLMVSHLYLIAKVEKKESRLVQVTLFILFFTFLSSFQAYFNPRGMVAFVDVGQGDAFFIQQPFNRGSVLVDVGGSLDYDTREEWRERQRQPEVMYHLVPFLKSRGISHIDDIYITHAHEDHFGNLLELNQEIGIKQVYFGEGTGQQANFSHQLSQMPTTTKHVLIGPKEWEKQGLKYQLLLPTSLGDGQNNDSLVMRVGINKDTFLLVGDLEKEGENDLLANYPATLLQSDVLKVGHHGSPTSSQSEFLQAVAPTQSVISCGRNNRYHHPSDKTLESLRDVDSSIYRTDEQGMIYGWWSPLTKKSIRFHTMR